MVAGSKAEGGEAVGGKPKRPPGYYSKAAREARSAAHQARKDRAQTQRKIEDARKARRDRLAESRRSYVEKRLAEPKRQIAAPPAQPPPAPEPEPEPPQVKRRGKIKNAAKTARKMRSAEQLQRERDKRLRKKLIDAGIPAHRVAGDAVHEFGEREIVDVSGQMGEGRNRRFHVMAVLFPTIVDRWLNEGGVGFEEPQRRAIEHCRALWAMIGSQRMVANYTGVGGGEGDAEAQMFALDQLAEYQKDIPVAYWRAFENAVRFDMPAGKAGSHLASNATQQQAHTKAAVGFVASLIAMWNKF